MHQACLRFFILLKLFQVHWLLQTEKEEQYASSNFGEVKEYINDTVINEKQPALMQALYQIYGLDIGKTRYQLTPISWRNAWSLNLVIKSAFWNPLVILWRSSSHKNIFLKRLFIIATSKLRKNLPRFWEMI